MIDPTTNHVQFDATLDDLIDVQMRFLRRSGVASSWPRADSLLVAAGAALLLFLVVQVLFHAALAPSLVGAGVAAAIAYVVYP